MTAFKNDNGNALRASGTEEDVNELADRGQGLVAASERLDHGA